MQGGISQLSALWALPPRDIKVRFQLAECRSHCLKTGHWVVHYLGSKACSWSRQGGRVERAQASSLYCHASKSQATTMEGRKLLGGHRVSDPLHPLPMSRVWSPWADMDHKTSGLTLLHGNSQALCSTKPQISLDVSGTTIGRGENPNIPTHGLRNPPPCTPGPESPYQVYCESPTARRSAERELRLGDLETRGCLQLPVQFVMILRLLTLSR